MYLALLIGTLIITSITFLLFVVMCFANNKKLEDTIKIAALMFITIYLIFLCWLAFGC